MTNTTTGTSGGATPPPPSPEKILREIKLAAIKAELLKPVATSTEDLLSTDPAKKKARDTIHLNYAKAAGKNPKGKLRTDYEAAAKSIQLTANDEDMDERLTAWIAAWLAPGKPIHALLKALEHAAAALDGRSGKLEAARDGAATRTARWAHVFGLWSNPETRIDLSYAADIPKVNSDINNEENLDYAMYRFWFDIVPRHLRYSETSVQDGDIKGLGKVRAAVKDLPATAEMFLAGKDRGDGSVYLIDPAALAGHRANIRDEWQKAAEDQAEAEVDYRIAPDDTASLKKTRERLEAEYYESVRSKLTPPAP